MPWKMDGDKHALSPDGKYLAVVGDKEFAIDPDQIVNKVGELTKEAEKHRRAAEEATESLKPWLNLRIEDKPADPQTVTEALQALRNVRDKKLLEAGEVQKIKDDAVRDFKTQVTERDTKITELQTRLETKEKGWAFAQSKFLQERMYLPPDMALKIFGDDFKVEGDKIVGYVGTDKIPSSKRVGELADFDEALSYLVERHPFKDRILKSDGASGSGTPNTSGNPNTNNADLAKLPPTDRLAAAWGAKQ